MKRITVLLLALLSFAACIKGPDNSGSRRTPEYLRSFILSMYTMSVYAPVSALNELSEEELTAPEFKPITVTNDHVRFTISRIEQGVWAARSEDFGVKYLTLIYMSPQTYEVMGVVKHDWQASLPSGNYDESPYSCQYHTKADIAFRWKMDKQSSGVIGLKLVPVAGSLYGETYTDGVSLDYGEVTFNEDGTTSFHTNLSYVI